MDSILESRMDRLLKLEKPNNVLTMWSIDEICQRLQTDLISERLEVTDKLDMLAKLYQLLGLKVAVDNLEDNMRVITKGYELLKVVYYSNKIVSNENRVKLLLQLCSSGIISDRYAEVRMILNEEELSSLYKEVSKENTILSIRNGIFIIYLLLIRKLNGWNDIDEINNIFNDVSNKIKLLDDLSEDQVYILGAYLYILEALENYKNYILEGQPANIEKVITRNIVAAKKILGEYNFEEMYFTCTLIRETLIRQVQTALWSTVNGISEKLDEYVRFLTLRSNNKPIFELWPSQKAAIASNLFDTNKSAVIVQMPTSAGKSLLAKFYILQVRSLYATAKIAYLVPTRALVNQVKRDLKREFEAFNMSVEIAIPFMELDDIEEEVLIKNTDIIITTPEKLDIMLRAKHPFIEQLKLVVVDEAHSIQDENRGAKLELLLAMLRKQDRNLKILMLSPFMKNASHIAKWLSGDRGLDIFVDWKPSQQYTGVDKIREGSRGKHREVVTYIPSALNDMYHKEFTINVTQISRKDISKLDRALNLALKYEKLGGVLILCTQRQYAEQLVVRFNSRSTLEQSKLNKLKRLLDLIEEEMGVDSLLYISVKKGCAYHHSAIPLVIREEIEDAICKGLITIVAATTTLAQGMNFPIATVIFQGMGIPTEGMVRPMTTAEFWNIAGRAGRALVDKEGHIIAICNKENDEDKFRGYLQEKNQEVFSSLLEVVKELPVDCLRSHYIEQHKELSAFLQYVYHTLKVNSEIEIEDLLRGSYVYANLEELGQIELGEKLLNITQNYISKISLDLKKRNLMDIIDKTGLSSISMHKLIRHISNSKEMHLNAKTIFNMDDNMLSKYIELANSIAEINLGIYDSDKPFNPEVVANITKAWVAGESIRSIAKYINDPEKSIDDRMSTCGKYIYGKLINNLPWALSAILKAEGIVNKQDDADDNNMLIPSYVYFGVNNRIAVILCMLGVTRYASSILAREWRQSNRMIELENPEKIKEWLEKLELNQWREIFKRYNGHGVDTNYEIYMKNR